jgi:glyoxylase-like metal-dependent hydrolase (beta-lactamase superfamily II)
MHPADRAVLAQPGRRGARLMAARQASFLRSLAPSAEAAQTAGRPEQYVPFASVALPDRTLADGDLVDVPGWRLRAVHTPGHTPGHLFRGRAVTAPFRRRPHPAADHAECFCPAR